MIRLTAIVSLFALTIASFLAPLAAVHPGTVVIGGEYTVQPGEIRHGDLVAIFAQIKIAEGGEVTGQINTIGGELDVAGSVAENIQAIGSKLTVDSTANVTGEVKSVDIPQIWFLLPSILLVVS